jgi:hypothetical protein
MKSSLVMRGQKLCNPISINLLAGYVNGSKVLYFGFFILNMNFGEIVHP